jgi:hypothetical protein
VSHEDLVAYPLEAWNWFRRNRTAPSSEPSSNVVVPNSVPVPICF